MQILLSASESFESSVVPKNLSSRFVRTWREKVIDKHRWLRGSRLVAREYAWLSADLFSSEQCIRSFVKNFISQNETCLIHFILS